MSQQQNDDSSPDPKPTEPRIKDTPTHRYDLMQMRVNEIQGLVTVLQSRRLLHISKNTRIKASGRIAHQKSTDAKLSAVMNRLEKIITRMLKDEDAITKTLNEARALILDASDGTLVLEKTEKL